MKIPLNEFEKVIDEEILKKGLSYFKRDAIINITEVSTGEYEAIVSGKKEYTVHLKVNNDTIIKHDCDCSNNMGVICKHTVAVIFYLEKDQLELKQSNFTIPKKEKTKSVSQQVEELLKVISYEELIEFVQENSKTDTKFRNYFLASCNHLSKNQSKEIYQKQIHSILEIALERDGWIGWEEMKYVTVATKPFIENVKKYLEKNNFENVFFISTALLEEMTEALQYTDRGSDELMCFIESSIDLLSKIAQECVSNKLKHEIIEYCISSFNQKLFKGWDWHLDMLRIASYLIEGENQADTVLNALDTVTGEYDIGRTQSFHLDLLKRFKNEKEVENYISKNISNSSIRTTEIEKAFKNKNFQRVINLSKDGIICDEKNRPRLVDNWCNYLLKAAQIQNNIHEIIEYSRCLFIKNNGYKQDYYQILKDSVENQKWHSFLEEIIKEITPEERWTYTELIRMIYIKEEWWDRLFLMLKQNLSMENIQENEEYLSKDYSSELIEMYSERIIKYVERFVGRNNYQTACNYLGRMKKLGGNEKVNQLIDLFRTQYPQRRALMDELNRV